MSASLNVAVVGDYDHAYRPHMATNDALRHAAARLGVGMEIAWASTESLHADLGPVRTADALWCAPGSPYRSMRGALSALRHGREQGVPTIGTCGGCQHMIIEYARKVLGFDDAQHAEYDPYGSRLFVSELSCSLVGKTMPVNLLTGSKAAALYATNRVHEQYYCNFGLNPEYRQILHDAGMPVVGVDDDGEARVLEVPEHPFYLATLFVPQARSTAEQPHPLAVALLHAALEAGRVATVDGVVVRDAHERLTGLRRR